MHWLSRLIVRAEPERETWTPDRRSRVRLIDYFNGDVDAARRSWTEHSRQTFARWLISTGRLGWDDRDDR